MMWFIFPMVVLGLLIALVTISYGIIKYYQNDIFCNREYSENSYGEFVDKDHVNCCIDNIVFVDGVYEKQKVCKGFVK